MQQTERATPSGYELLSAIYGTTEIVPSQTPELAQTF
jgi:hypothetical protein